jgi:hypothetical protein
VIQQLPQTTINPDLEGLKYEFIDDCFVTIADKDYITARICYKYGLFENFLWCALQCIEKYIKAILLFHDYSTKNIGHDLKKGIELIIQIPDINWDFDDNFNDFVKEYLKDYGKNRCFESPVRNMFPWGMYRRWANEKNLVVNTESYLSFIKDSDYKNSNYLNQLDNSVWQIRRYCFNIPFWRKYRASLLPKYLNYLSSNELKNNPLKFNHRGYLDDVRKGKRGTALKNALNWRNKYFANKNVKNGGLMINHFEKMPPHLQYIQIMEESWFKNNIHLTKEFKASIKSELGIDLNQ